MAKLIKIKTDTSLDKDLYDTICEELTSIGDVHKELSEIIIVAAVLKSAVFVVLTLPTHQGS